nr:MAG TPA: hypothetical protein [Caudoviricetes sp.]
MKTRRGEWEFGGGRLGGKSHVSDCKSKLPRIQ